jgi:hypothetical protein
MSPERNQFEEGGKQSSLAMLEVCEMIRLKMNTEGKIKV